MIQEIVNPPERLSFEQYGCLLALSASLRSIDPNTKVGGAAFDKNKRILNLSYNGLKPGMETPINFFHPNNRELKSKLMIHCESNLCGSFKRGECELMALTHSPCFSCAKLIVGMDVKKVVFIKEYKKSGTELQQDFKQIFDFYGIKYEQLPKSGLDKIKTELYNLTQQIW